MLRHTVAGPEVAVVRRWRHGGGQGDLVLPKGKAEPGETMPETALREVAEETGCRGRITGPGIPCEYQVGGRPKRVLYFPMEFEAQVGEPDAAEVRAVLWLRPGEAAARLSYETERAVLGQALPDRVRRV